jgi:hypothetical protein
LILTAQEYAKGFIDFDAVLPDGTSVELWTMTADQTTFLMNPPAISVVE